VARTACVSVYRYLLQIVLLRRQQWRHLPCVVVSEDRPGGVVLDADRYAFHLGVRPGMRFAAALSLAPSLRADVVSPAERDRTDREIVRALYRISPEIETFPDDPGVFRIGVGGMERIVSSPRAWADTCRQVLGEKGFRCHVAIGPSRAVTYVAAMGGGHAAGQEMAEGESAERGGSRSGDAPRHEAEVTVCATAEDETRIFAATPLEALTLARRDRGLLLDLGIGTAAAFRAMPKESIRTRFGHATVVLHAFLQGEGGGLPVSSADLEPERRYSRECPHPVRELERLLWLLEPLLHQAVEDLRRCGEQVAELTLELWMDDNATQRQTVRPARPSGNVEFLSRLIRLRLEQASLRELSLSAGVVRCFLQVEPVPIVTEQGTLFHHRTDRNMAHVEEAISRVRARFGSESVGRFVPRDGYLPEDALAWEAAERPPVDDGSPADDVLPTLVRRVLLHPVPLQSIPGAPCAEPYRLSGRWWKGGYRRVYCYLETPDGQILWVYREGQRGPWMIQGFVE
jgi:protein ImuB